MSGRAPAGELYVVSPDGRDDVRLTRDSISVHDEAPAWSPCGALAFARGGDIYVYDEAGTRRLTSSPLADTEPSWSPDCTRLAFVRSRVAVPGARNIMIVAAEGGPAVTLATGDLADPGHPAWSPDGRKLLFNHSGGLRVLDLATTEYADVARGPFFQPEWSPDGQTIMATRHTASRTDLYVVDPYGERPRRLTRTPDVEEMDPSWSPDGTRLVYAAKATTGWDLFIMDLWTGKLRPLVTSQGTDAAPHWLPAHPRWFDVGVKGGEVVGLVRSSETTCSSAPRVHVARRKDGRWRTVSSVRADEGGHFRLSLSRGVRRGRLSITASLSDGKACGPASLLLGR